MPDDSHPLRAEELEGLFSPFAEAIGKACALAVSGGSDSTALMVLFADWLRLRGADPQAHAVLTVDHGLRAGSAAEARAVAERAAALGFRHAILAWQGPRPDTGIQAAAREARYRLIGAYMAQKGLATVLVAHTRDDQAETLLMRLSRGSGLDGLAAMAPYAERTTGSAMSPLRIVRPLLGVSKARLRATLEQRGIAWTEDPGNRSPAFERTRWRAAREHLDALGLSDEALATSAARLQRARAALETATDDFCAGEAGAVETDPVGLFRIDRERLRRAPEEVALRVMARCIAAAGGVAAPISLAKLEALVTGLRVGAAHCGWTLARAQVTAAADAIWVEREPGRLPLPVITVAAGFKGTWDGRFAIEIAAGLESSVEARALGEDGIRALRRAEWSADRSGLRLTLSCWREGELLAVPAIDFWAQEGLDGVIAARFVGIRYNSGAAGAAGGSRGPRY